MPLYRALDHLDNGVRKGRVFNHSRIKAENVQRLIEVGAIAEVRAPPLLALPDPWPDRAARVADAGIVDLEQLIDAVEVDGVTYQELVDWQQQAYRLLTIESKCCGGK